MLTPEEKLLMNKVEEARKKASGTIGHGCTTEAHDAVVEQTSLQADMTQLIFMKLDGIYDSLNEIKRAMPPKNGGSPLPGNWSDTLKMVAVRAPYALAAVVVALVFWLWASDVDPGRLLGAQALIEARGGQ
jgi:hypothetical protein